MEALADACKHSIPTQLKILAAAQPRPGGRLSNLKKVKEELQIIQEIVPSENLIYLHGNQNLDLEGVYTSTETVLAKISEASILHLACHATQDINNPLNSGFFLGDGKRLTIHKLIQSEYQFPNAFMAILSACHTASNDTEQPEEAINIASTLMFLGFKSILGTNGKFFIIYFSKDYNLLIKVTVLGLWQMMMVL